MAKKQCIEAWRKGQCSGYSLKDVKKELESHGFVLEPTKSHWRAIHPGLKDSGHFPAGFVLFSAHAFGKQGEVHPAAIRDFVKAIDWLEDE
jgi:hypothetical protein